MPFLRDGLRNGEGCLYVADGVAVDEWYRELQATVSTYARRMRPGRWTLPRATPGVPGARGGLWRWRGRCLSWWTSSWTTLPLSVLPGDIAWATEPTVDSATSVPLGSDGQCCFPGLPVRVICQYNMERYEPAFIHAALRTHPIVLYKGRRVKSPHYEAPKILEQEPRLNGCSNDAKAVADMLAQLMPRAA